MPTYAFSMEHRFFIDRFDNLTLDDLGFAFYDENVGYAIGGDFTKPDANKANKIKTVDGGKTCPKLLRRQPIQQQHMLNQMRHSGDTVIHCLQIGIIINL